METTLLVRGQPERPAPLPCSADYCADENPEVRLTTREMQIVRLLMEGHTERAIAYRLGIKRNTVHSHLAGIHKRLGVSGRGALVASLIAYDIIPLSEVRSILAAQAVVWTQDARDQSGD